MPLFAHVRRAVCPLLIWSCSAIALTAGPPAPEMYRQKERTFYSAEEFARATGGRMRIEHRVDPAQEAALRRAYVPLPVTEFTVIAASGSVTWLGTRSGAIRLGPGYSSREVLRGPALVARRPCHRHWP